MAFSDGDHLPFTAIAALQAIYGPPSQAGFGSAVFVQQSEPGPDLESIALKYYQHFVGELWDRFGSTAWMSTWQQVYDRPQGIQPDIVAELRAIDDQNVSQFVPILLLEETENQTQTEQALAAVYDQPKVTDLQVYTIGDGAAVAGLMLLGRYAAEETVILISLLD